MENLNIIKPKSVQGIINKFCYTIGMIPSSYKLSLTYEEQILAIGQYLEEVVYPAINNNAEALAELQSLFVDLRNYVENYFDNLDIQEEVNNKIEEMIQSGQLSEIITSYLELNGILAFNTVNDLKNATNVINGSFTRTFGKLTYNDGEGAFYKIRNITTDDLIDNINIIKINSSDTLIAELIKNIDNEEHYVIIGDSYCAGYTPQGTIKGWGEYLKELLGLNNTNCHIIAQNGAGFVDPTTFLTLLQNQINNIQNKTFVKKVIVCAGYNDRSYTPEEIQNAIETFSIYVNQMFPNAKLYIGQIGWNINLNENNKRVQINNNSNTGYSQFTQNTKNAQYLNNVQYSLMNKNLFSSDGYHPNAQGQLKLARAIYQALQSGKATFYDLRSTININYNNNPTVSNESAFTEFVNDGMLFLYNTQVNLTYETPQNYDGNNFIILGTYNSKYVTPLATYSTSIPCRYFVINSNNEYFGGMGELVFSTDGNVYLEVTDIEKAGWANNNYKSIRIYANSNNMPINYA